MFLTKNELKEILKKQPVEFVVANIGNRLEWIPVEKCFEVWKTRIKNRIVDDFEHIKFNSFPNEFAYIASLWGKDFKNPIILLEMYH